MNSVKDLTLTQQQMMERELDKGERVEWVALPKPVLFSKSSIGTFLFGIPWTAFSIFWVAAAGNGIWGGGGANVPFLFKFFPLFGVPFILVGLGMLSSPFWSYFSSKKTFYVITERRVISFSGGRSITVRSFQPEQLLDTYRINHTDGTGDVLNDYGFRLARVRDPNRVEELINRLAEQYQPEALEGVDERNLGFGNSGNSKDW